MSSWLKRSWGWKAGGGLIALAAFLASLNGAVQLLLKVPSLFGWDAEEASMMDAMSSVVVSGAVFDDAHTPLIGVVITAPSLNLRTLTNQNGHFRLESDYPAGDIVDLIARKEGYSPRNLYAPINDPTYSFIMRRVK